MTDIECDLDRMNRARLGLIEIERLIPRLDIATTEAEKYRYAKKIKHQMRLTGELSREDYD